MLRQNRLSRINIVTTTKPGRTPGRPRQFDAEQAIETAQRLFHARGYDAVSVADRPTLSASTPELLCCFRQQARAVYPRPAALQPDRGHSHRCPAARRPAGGGVAHRRTAGGGSPLCGRSGRRRLHGAGGVHCQDADARVAAGEWHAAARAKIQQYIARHRPQDALRVTDYMDTLMLGLSAKAREGDSLPRLLETVRLAGPALERILPA